MTRPQTTSILGGTTRRTGRPIGPGLPLPIGGAARPASRGYDPVTCGAARPSYELDGRGPVDQERPC